MSVEYLLKYFFMSSISCWNYHFRNENFLIPQTRNQNPFPQSTSNPLVPTPPQWLSHSKGCLNWKKRMTKSNQCVASYKKKITFSSNVIWDRRNLLFSQPITEKIQITTDTSRSSLGVPQESTRNGGARSTWQSTATSGKRRLWPPQRMSSIDLEVIERFGTKQLTDLRLLTLTLAGKPRPSLSLTNILPILQDPRGEIWRALPIVNRDGGRRRE